MALHNPEERVVCPCLRSWERPALSDEVTPARDCLAVLVVCPYPLQTTTIPKKAVFLMAVPSLSW